MIVSSVMREARREMESSTRIIQAFVVGIWHWAMALVVTVGRRGKGGALAAAVREMSMTWLL